MKPLSTFLIISLLGFSFLGGCGSESDSSNSGNSDEVILGKLEISNGWARPGTEGQNSAVYLTIHNGTATADTLLNISSDVTDSAEIHESIQSDDGTTSMRPAGQQIVDEAEQLRLEPGGLHIMLMDLTQNLEVNDSLTVSLEFARVGTKNISVPVQTQN